MTFLLVFVGFLFTIIALWLTVAPFLGGADAGLRLEYLDEEVREIELLVAQREVLVRALRELEFDRETDKLAPEDYERFRKRYEHQAVVILKRLDEIHGGRDWRERVDAELTERLGRAPATTGAAEVAAEIEPPPSSPDRRSASEDAAEPNPIAADDSPADDIENDDADAAEGTETAPPCVTCGEPLDDDDRFCSQCGTPVAVHETAPVQAKSEASA